MKLRCDFSLGIDSRHSRNLFAARSEGNRKRDEELLKDRMYLLITLISIVVGELMCD
jgi:hypothetical protein